MHWNSASIRKTAPNFAFVCINASQLPFWSPFRWNGSGPNICVCHLCLHPNLGTFTYFIPSHRMLSASCLVHLNAICGFPALPLLRRCDIYDSDKHATPTVSNIGYGGDMLSAIIALWCFKPTKYPCMRKLRLPAAVSYPPRYINCFANDGT